MPGRGHGRLVHAKRARPGTAHERPDSKPPALTLGGCARPRGPVPAVRTAPLPGAPDQNQTVSCRLGLQPVPASTQASSASATGPGSVNCPKSSTCTVRTFAISACRCSFAGSSPALPSGRPLSFSRHECVGQAVPSPYARELGTSGHPVASPSGMLPGGRRSSVSEKELFYSVHRSGKELLVLWLAEWLTGRSSPNWRGRGSPIRRGVPCSPHGPVCSAVSR